MENNSLLELDLEAARKIIDFIKKQTADLNKQGAVVGLRRWYRFRTCFKIMR